MKLRWYWYVMRGAGSILETHRRETGKGSGSGGSQVKVLVQQCASDRRSFWLSLMTERREASGLITGGKEAIRSLRGSLRTVEVRTLLFSFQAHLR